MLTSRSPFGCQLAPPSDDFHMPPATPAVHIMLLNVLWIRSARDRPPMLPGPAGSHGAASVPVAVRSADPVEADAAEAVIVDPAAAVEWTGMSATTAAASSSSVMLIASP